MNPILRWTIGSVDRAGFRMIAHSVKLIKKNYKDRFDLFICHNNLSKDQIEFLKTLDVGLVVQCTSGDLICKPSGVAWKLYPPRLDIKRHEIFIDNDLIIYKNLEEIEWFLDSSDRFIATEGLRRLFGSRDAHVPKGLKINSGLFGVPPNFDFAHAINNMCRKNCWNDRYDEQGVVASIICQHNYRIIPITKITVCLDNFTRGTHGIHFVGVNYGFTPHWDKFLIHKMM